MKIYKRILLMIFCFFNLCNCSNIKNTKSVDDFYGIYLPDIYINELANNKSHIQAGIDVQNIQGLENALVIRPNKTQVLQIWNFHEGGGGNINKINNNTIYVNDIDKSEYQLFDGYVVKNKKYKLVRITNNYDDYHHEISMFITKEVFGNKTYNDNKKQTMYIDKDGIIIYQEKKYELQLDLVFCSQKYDLISSKDGNENLYFQFTNNKLVLYSGLIPDEYKYDFFPFPYIQFTKINELN